MGSTSGRSPAPLEGSLTIVGLGPAGPELVTIEAAERIRSAVTDGCLVLGLPHARHVARALAPGLEVSPLESFYASPGLDRTAVYDSLARMLVREAFLEHRDVLYLVAGSPLFVNDTVTLVRHFCEVDGHPLRLIHGLSFLEFVLERVHWSGHGGLQLYSAWNVARDGVVLDSCAPALLFQLGEPGPHAVAPDRGPLVDLRDRLREHLPEDHPVIILYSSEHPDYRSLARRLPLGALAGEVVPLYSNLWVPSLDASESERTVAVRLQPEPA